MPVRARTDRRLRKRPPTDEARGALASTPENARSTRTPITSTNASPSAPVESARPDTFDRIANWAARHVGHQDPNTPHGPNVVTHERPVVSGSAFVGFVEVGYTLSELNQIRVNNGTELIHVVNPDGSSNLELVLRRFQPAWMHEHRFELQGPALNTSLSGPPLGARFLGFGVTGDQQTAHSKDALSYTVEVKLTERSAAELAALAAPGVAAEVGELLGEAATESVGRAVAGAFLGAVPIVSGAIALVSIQRALRVCTDKTSTQERRVFAVAHAVADAVRVVLPIPGTLMNVGLVAGAAAREGVKLHTARAQLQRQALQTAGGDDG